MKYLGLFLAGYLFHILVGDLGSLSYQIRWTDCVEKMHTGENPDLATNGQHYCLYSTKTPTKFENFANFNLGLWAIYEQKVTRPRLRKAYEESQKK